jgi:thiol:disulfide interchange protein
LVADYSNESPEIRKWLNRFDSISVPLTVIFPGSRPDRPIVLRDVYTKSTLLAKLREAVGDAGS